MGTFILQANGIDWNYFDNVTRSRSKYKSCHENFTLKHEHFIPIIPFPMFYIDYFYKFRIATILLLDGILWGYQIGGTNYWLVNIGRIACTLRYLYMSCFYVKRLGPIDIDKCHVEVQKLTIGAWWHGMGSRTRRICHFEPREFEKKIGIQEAHKRIFGITSCPFGARQTRGTIGSIGYHEYGIINHRIEETSQQNPPTTFRVCHQRKSHCRRT